MVMRALSHTPFGQITIKVHHNGWTVAIGGKDVPMNEVAQQYHAEIRRNVREVCHLNGWDLEVSEL